MGRFEDAGGDLAKRGAIRQEIVARKGARL